MKYKYTKNPDGTYTVYAIPVFVLGTHRDFAYDEAWAARLVDNHTSLQQKDHLPPIFIGHNSPWGSVDEKAANGFLSNIRNVNGTIFADFVIHSEQDFQLIRELKYPYRSVEVHNADACISGIAMLGGTEPYFKFPRLQLEQGEEAPSYCVMPYDGDYSFEETGKPSDKSIFSFFSKKKPPSHTHIPPQDPPSADQKPNYSGGNMDRETFKATFGYYPEEAQAFKAENEQMKARLAEQSLAQFKSDLQHSAVSPAAIEVISKSPFSADPAFCALVKDIIKFASEDTLIVRAGDTVPSSPSAGYAQLDEDAIVAQAQKLVTEGKFASLVEAVKHVKSFSKK